MLDNDRARKEHQVVMYTREEVHEAVKTRGVPTALKDTDGKIDTILDATAHYVRSTDGEKVWDTSIAGTIASQLNRELVKEPWYTIHRLNVLEQEVSGNPAKNAVKHSRLIVQWYFDANNIDYRGPSQIG